MIYFLLSYLPYHSTDCVRELQINKYVNVSALKHYFNVSNAYVMQKLYIVLFPWRHRPWSRQQTRMGGANGQSTEFLPPREDINSPGIPPTLFLSLPLTNSSLC